MYTKKLFSVIYSILLNIGLVLALLFGSLAFPTKAHAFGSTILVNTTVDNTTQNGLCSLREAIINANNNNQTHADCIVGLNADHIMFADSLGAATITLSSVLPPITDSLGLTIHGGNDITISGANLYQAFSVHQLGYLILDGLTIKNGKSSIINIGGAIWNAGKLEVTNCYFSNNSADSGGAIYSGVNQLTVKNSNFYNNKSSNGGAIFNEGGRIVIQGGSFSENSAPIGGAISNYFVDTFRPGTLDITGTSFSLNTAKYGAGIYNSTSAQLNLTNASILKNKATTGGGIYNLGGMLIKTSEISANSAKTGGGIYNFSGPTTLDNPNVFITNSILKRNVADLGAGIYNQQSGLSMNSTQVVESAGIGLYNYGGKVAVSNGTFSSNSGHAIYNYGEEASALFAILRVENSIFSNNSGMGIYNDFGQSNIFTSTFQKNGSSGLYNVKDSVVTVDRSSFLANNSKYGGGIYNDASHLNVHNTTLYANTAIQGGGLYNSGTAYIRNSTFSNNAAEVYDGVLNAPSGYLELYNTIIAKSGGLGIDCTNAPGGTILGNNNLIQAVGSAACDFVDGVNGNLIGYDPGFGPLTGSPAYLPINTSSPAFDTGDDAQCAVVSNQSQNGVTRPQGVHCDIGSYEMPFDK